MDERKWINPRYAWLAAEWQRAQQPESRTPEARPARGFIVPPPKR